MGGQVHKEQIRLAFQELDRQLKEAQLYALRYGKGWDRVTELQFRHRQYALALEELRQGKHSSQAQELPTAA